MSSSGLIVQFPIVGSSFGCERTLRSLEIQRAGVDAVAQTCRFGAVGKHVAEMAAAARAENLGAVHSVRRVEPRLDAVQRGRLEEARPAGAGVEFRVGAEELGAAAGA